MIDLALFRRTIRDYVGLWAAVALILFVFVILFMYAVHATPIGQQGADFLKLPFIRRVLTVMLGSDPLQMLTPTGISGFAFTHPLTWTLLIVFVLTMSTGFIAGEMDRGTMDLLATLPISRVRVYSTLGMSVTCLAIPLCWVVWLGVLVGRRVSGAAEVDMAVLVRVAWHLSAVVTLIAAFSTAISAMFARRGQAVALSFFLVFYAFVLNLLRAIWTGLDALKWTDFLYYYSSTKIVRDMAYQWRDIAVLLSAAAIWWVIGLTVFIRRDIPAR